MAHPLAFAKAFRLLKHPGFLVVTLVALPIAMIHQCYFFRSSPFLAQDIGVPERWIGWTMGIGQASEIVFLALLGLFLKRLGYRVVLAMGGMAYVLRFAIFAVGEPHWLVIAAQALHGLCYGCFFAGAYLYVEKVASEDIRHSAQTVFGIIILGVGPVLAGLYNQVFDRFTKPITVAAQVSGSATTAPSSREHVIAELTRADSNAMAKVPAHGYADGATVVIAGARQAEYNGAHVIAVRDRDTFTYTLGGAPESPASGLQIYHQFWWTESAVALAATLFLLVLFPRNERAGQPSSVAA